MGFIKHLFNEIIDFRDIISNCIKLISRSNNLRLQLPLEIDAKNLNNIYIYENVKIRKNLTLRLYDDCKLIIGKRVEIDQNCHISGAKNKIIIGNDVGISDNCLITSSYHNYQDIEVPVNDQGFDSAGDVVIGDHSQLGVGVAVFSGVNIGERSYIGAHSVATRDIPPYSVAVGAPAKVISQYNFETKQWERVKK